MRRQQPPQKGQRKQNQESWGSGLVCKQQCDLHGQWPEGGVAGHTSLHAQTPRRQEYDCGFVSHKKSGAQRMCAHGDGNDPTLISSL